MADAPIYLYEFLWRGGPNGGAGAYHVVLAQDTKDGFGNVSTATSGALTPEQAKAQGFDIKTVVAEINTDTMAEATRQTARADAAEAKAKDLQGQIDALSAQLAAVAKPDDAPKPDATTTDTTKPAS